MKKLFSYAGLTAVLLGGPAAAADAGELNLTIANGRVTLIAHDVTVRQILAEWARVGQTRIVNGEKLIGPPLTIELRDVPETKALETVLRTAAGYVVAPRMGTSSGSSTFDSVVILATSRAPAVTVSAPAPFARPQPQPQPMMPTVDEPEQEEAQGPVPTGAPVPGPTMPGMPTDVQQGGPPQGPMTSPRPGQLPPPPGPGNPYQPGQPGTRAPGTPGGPPRPGGGPGGGPDGA